MRLIRTSILVVGIAVLASTLGFARLGRAQTLSSPIGLVAETPPNQSAIALVFEGGPGPQTSRIAARLKELYVPATFFYPAEPAAAYRSLVKTLVGSGDEVSLSGYTYVDLQSLSTPAVVAQLTAGEELMRGLTGRRDRWFSPPFGDVDSRIIGIASSLGLKTVLWSINSYDLTNSSGTAMAKVVESSASGGAIILFHDSQSDATNTLAALQDIVPRLKYRGYRFGTVNELFGEQPLPPCVPNELTLFDAKGVHPVTGSPIFNFWVGRLCRGVRLGPATSAQFYTRDGTTAQNFGQYGRQIVFNPISGRTFVQKMWNWGEAIFSAKKIKPNFHQPITKAWFSRYFEGVDEGAALTAAERFGSLTVQQFTRGWALSRTGKAIVWTTHYKPPKIPPTPTPTIAKPKPTSTAHPKAKATAHP